MTFQVNAARMSSRKWRSHVFLGFLGPPSSTRKGLELPKEGKFPFRETNFGVAVKKAKEAAASGFGARTYGETMRNVARSMRGKSHKTTIFLGEDMRGKFTICFCIQLGWV